MTSPKGSFTVLPEPPMVIPMLKQNQRAIKVARKVYDASQKGNTAIKIFLIGFAFGITFSLLIGGFVR
jgi:hypothetical protein